jgi:hypothetical protein
VSAIQDAGAVTPTAPRAPAWTWWREASGAVADLGVLVPIAVTLIVVNGLAVTAVLLPAGLAYLMVARVYGVPVAVQPLKAFGAAAIAAGAGVEVIAAGALLMGVVFLLLGTTGWLDRVAGVFPRAVVRGIQLAVGLTFARIAWGLVAEPPEAFDVALSPVLAGAVAVVLVAVLLRWPRAVALVVVLAAVVVAVVLAEAPAGGAVWGPTTLALPEVDGAALATAAVLLVLPQLPLTFANSCLAPADAAPRYFGERAARVTPGRLAFPLSVLAALLVVAGVAHVRLLSDLHGRSEWVVALLVGVAGLVHLGLAVVVGLVLHTVLVRVARRRGTRSAATVGAADRAEGSR